MAIRDTQTIRSSDVQTLQASDLTTVRRGRPPGVPDADPLEEFETTVVKRPDTINYGRPASFGGPRGTKNWFILRVLKETAPRDTDTPEQAAQRAEAAVSVRYDKAVIQRLTTQLQGWNGRLKKAKSPEYPGIRIIWSYSTKPGTSEKIAVAFWAERVPPPATEETAGDGDDQQPEYQEPPPPRGQPGRPTAQAPRGPQQAQRWAPR
jgi:hypothetical protein